MSFDDIKRRRADEDREREMQKKAEQAERKHEDAELEQEADRLDGMVRKVLTELGDAVMGKSLGFLPRYTITGPIINVLGGSWILSQRGGKWTDSFVRVHLIVSSYGTHFNVDGTGTHICDGVSEDELRRALRTVIRV